MSVRVASSFQGVTAHLEPRWAACAWQRTEWRRLAVVLALVASATDVSAQPPRHAIHSMEVPGGVASALAVSGSTAEPERARFVLDLTRRFYNSPKEADEREESGRLPTLLDHMTVFTRAREATARLDPTGQGVFLARARDKAGYEAHKQWAKAVGLELRGDRNKPRLDLPTAKEALALRLVLTTAGLEMSDVAKRLNAGEQVVVAIPFERVPLPLAPETWTSLILEHQVSAEAMVATILSSRTASLMYAALLALDDATRAWLVERPDLVRWIQQNRPGTFQVAASALRVVDGRLVLPGGEGALPVWQELADESPHDVERFFRRVLTRDDGRLAGFLASMHVLSEAQRSAALELSTAGIPERVRRVKDLYDAFARASDGWTAEARPFWRPPIDPLVILLTLQPTPAHPSGVPGTERFWREVFDADALVPSAKDAQKADDDARATTLGSLCERVFDADREEQRIRAAQVMYAARHAAALAAASVADAMTTVRAVRRVPALVLSLERAGVHDPTLVATLAARAEQVGTMGDDTRGLVALAQWQGALATVLAARADGGLPVTTVTELLQQLVTIAPSREGRFDGAVLTWTRSWTPLREEGETLDARPIERAWMAWTAGTTGRRDVRVSWEGTEYQLDIPAALLARQQKVRGPDVTPLVDLASRVAGVADRLGQQGVGVAQVQVELRALLPLASGFPRVKDGDAIDREIQDQWKEAVGQLRRITRPKDLERVQEAIAALTRVADALLGRGLMALAYARVLADHESAPLGPDEAARRHEFGLLIGGAMRERLPWLLPRPSSTGSAWRVEGSLLALDVALSASSLRRVSTRPLARAPLLNGVDRGTLADSVVLMSRPSLTDDTRDAIAQAMRRGRAAALNTTDVASRQAFAARAGMDATRASLWAWVAEHEPERLLGWVTPREALFAGLAGQEPPETWHPWGTSTFPATGCLCARLVGPMSWEAYAGRIGNTMLAVAVPDLQLRIVEQLAETSLPAALARDILSAAMRDVVDEAQSQHQDDWLALIDRVQRHDRDAFEQYVALLTADGPLRPVEAIADGARR